MAEGEVDWYSVYVLENSARRYYLATLTNVIIGKLDVSLEGQSAFIYGFAVQSEYRGRGYGRQILAFKIQELLAMGQEHIALEVATGNRNAFTLYQSCGFRETGSYDYYAWLFREIVSEEMSVQPICKGCGQLIWGNYLSALGATWHPEHFLCAACGRPIAGASFQMYEDVPYHLDCYRDRVAPRCAYCSKPLVSEYLVDQWGTQYCKEHQNQFPHCAYCGRLVPPQDREQGAESVRCPVCRSTAIETAEAAKPIFSQLIRWVGAQGLRYNNLRLSLELCGRTTLARHLRERSQTHSLGATMSTTYVQDGRALRTEVGGVAVLNGMPSTLFQGVTVHELGHVWLVVQGVQGLPAWAEEGFCELLSYRYYNELNTPESRYHATAIEHSPDPVYGEGFQRVRSIADSMGFQRFIEVMQATKRLPGG